MGTRPERRSRWCGARGRGVRLVGVLAIAAAAVGLAAPAVAVVESRAAQPAAADAPGAAPGGLAQAADGAQEVQLTVYHGAECARCHELFAWLDDVKAQHPTLTVTEYEVWHDDANRTLFEEAGRELGFTASSVPTVVLDERIWIGFTDQIAADMAGAIGLAADGRPVPAGMYGTAGAGTCDDEEATACAAGEDGGPAGAVIDVPFLGEVDLGTHSLLVSTIVIGFVDGINPCSLWAISVLLAIVVRTADRRRVIVIGSTFLLVTAAMYALYMVGIYSALMVVSHLGAIQLFVAAFAGVFGAFAVKDYFAFKKGLSFSIPEKSKPGIYQRMRATAQSKALLPAIGATVVLAVAVSLLETPCTAGFPVLWTGMLHAAGVGWGEAAFLFGAYMVPFLIDEFAVFILAVVTMRAAKLQEKHGQLLKLVAGVTMLVLAGVMVLDPSLMENPVAALGLFAGAFVTAWAIHAVTVRVRAARGLDGPARRHGTTDDDGDPSHHHGTGHPGGHAGTRTASTTERSS